jgi:hypothetical protein
VAIQLSSIGLYNFVVRCYGASQMCQPCLLRQFLYLHQGRVFEVEVRYFESPWDDGQGKLGDGKAHVERCWLCDQCATHIALRFDRRRGLITLSSLGDSKDAGTPGIQLSSPKATAGIERVLIRPLDLNLTSLNRRKPASKIDARRSEIA